jgi:hypothetical protein
MSSDPHASSPSPPNNDPAPQPDFARHVALLRRKLEVKSPLHPYRVAWRVIKWRGGFPFGFLLIGMGTSDPTYYGLATLGVAVVLGSILVFAGRLARADGAIRREERAAAAQPPAEESVEADTSYYDEWVGHEPAPGPYSTPSPDEPYRA